MKILALERDVAGVTDKQCAPHLAAEAARAWELNQAGVIRELYFRADRSAAVPTRTIREASTASADLAALAGVLGARRVPPYCTSTAPLLTPMRAYHDSHLRALVTTPHK